MPPHPDLKIPSSSSLIFVEIIFPHGYLDIMVADPYLGWKFIQLACQSKWRIHRSLSGRILRFQWFYAIIAILPNLSGLGTGRKSSMSTQPPGWVSIYFVSCYM